MSAYGILVIFVVDLAQRVGEASGATDDGDVLVDFSGKTELLGAVDNVLAVLVKISLVPVVVKLK